MPSSNLLDPYFSDNLKITEDQTNKIESIRQRIRTSGCTACPLHKARSGANPVPGAGRGRIMFVGHRIGWNEANEGEPAIGQNSLTGFRILIEAITGDVKGLSPTDARNHMLDYSFVSNAARCGGSKKNVGASAWKRCAPKWLEQEYRYIDPVIVVFWNKGAAETILGEAPGKGEVTTEYMFGEEQLVARNRHPVQPARQGEADHVLSIRRAVQSDFQQVLKALDERNYLNRKPAFGLTGHDTEHVLVSTSSGLEDMKEDLWDERWIGLDSETFYTAQPGTMTEYEESKGALLWHDSRQEMTCYQICASDPHSRTVDRTYTVAMRFKDGLTGEPKQKLEPHQAIGALKDLFSHSPRPNGKPVTREITFHNASFDAPVFTKEGLDMWGLGQRRYDIRIWDTQILAGRLNEYLGVKEGMSSLDNLAKMLLQEAKGSFTDEFDPFTFAYEDIHDEKRKEEILDYTGEDPRKTVLVLFELFDALEEHRREVEQDINPSPSAQPSIGFNPYPKPNTKSTGFRLRDVALPIDHQMIPHLGEMRFIGFEVDTDEIEQCYRFIQSQKQTLLRLIHDRYEWFNPQSDRDARKIIRRIFEEIADLLNSMYDSLPYHEKETLLETFQIESRNVDDEEGITESDVRSAYQIGYGEVDGQRKTILNKVLVFLQAGIRSLRSEFEVPEDLPDELNHEKMELFFERVFMYKQLHKRASTYFDRFANIADRHDHLRPEYGITTTVSGRFSGNFHNVPRGGEEDQELIEDYLRITDQLPEGEEEKEKAIEDNRRIDVRETCFVPQPEALNRTFETMNLQGPNENLWQVREDDTYVEITCDYASQEDRMAYALSGDETKAFLLNEGWDGHWTNVSFCFGEDYGFEVQNRDGSVDWDEMEKAYNFFTSNKTKYKSTLRTPMKNVHFASQYGGGDEKIHMLIAPIFEKQGEDWSLDDTRELKARYDELYAGVTQHREEIVAGLDESPYVNYPIWGAIRHAKIESESAAGYGTHDVLQNEYLSVANAINQGSCAYMTKVAMIRTRHLIEANAKRWNLVHQGGDTYVGINLQVHDELGLVCPARLARECIDVLESGMKFAVQPGQENAYWNYEYTDELGKDGWMCISDPGFEGGVLFDADAEVKRTVAKSETLSDGTKNVLAHSHDPNSIDELEKKYPPTGIDRSEDLVVANGHEIDTSKYLF